MSDADALEREFRSGRLLPPRPDVLNLVDLANAASSLVCARSRPLAGGAERLAGMIGPADHLVLVAADGLGTALVESLEPGGFMRRHLAASLRTTFPSTTAAALTSLATGEWPNRHAALGWYTYIPDVGSVATILRFVRSSDGASLSDLGLSVNRALPAPPIASAAGRPLLSLMPAEIADSAFSRYVGGGRPATGYDSLDEAAACIVAAVLSAPGPTLTHLYVPHVDTAGHSAGFSSGATLEAAAALERTLEGLADGLSGRARLVVTADHGGLDAAADRVHVLRASDPLARMLRSEPSGDSRVAYFHVGRGREPEFEDAFRERLGGRFFLLTAGQAERMRLLGPGPLSAEVRRRVGTFVAVSRGADVMVYERSPGGRGEPPAGHHSGLTPAEMLVPLILA